jgi:hypothetical protein
MNKTDISVIYRKKLTVVSSPGSDIFFYRRDETVTVFSSSKLTASMLDDMEASGIVEIRHASLNEGLVLMDRKEFYDREKFTNVIVALFEKYNL